MRRCRSWYRIRQLLHTRLPLPPGPLRDSLALWLQGTLWVGRGVGSAPPPLPRPRGPLGPRLALWLQGTLGVGRGVASPRHSPLPGLD